MQLFTNLGLFFALMAIFVCVPLIAVIVGILVKGIIELQYVILTGGALLLGFLMIWFVRQAVRFFRSFKGTPERAGEALKGGIAAGEAIEMSIFGGLFKIVYKGKQGELNATQPETLPYAAKELTHASAGPASHDPATLVDRLQQLADLKDRGDIDAGDYETMKNILLRRHADTGAYSDDCVGM